VAIATTTSYIYIFVALTIYVYFVTELVRKESLHWFDKN